MKIPIMGKTKTVLFIFIFSENCFKETLYVRLNLKRLYIQVPTNFSNKTQTHISPPKAYLVNLSHLFSLVKDV